MEVHDVELIREVAQEFTANFAAASQNSNLIKREEYGKLC